MDGMERSSVMTKPHGAKKSRENHENILLKMKPGNSVLEESYAATPTD